MGTQRRLVSSGMCPAGACHATIIPATEETGGVGSKRDCPRKPRTAGYMNR